MEVQFLTEAITRQHSIDSLKTDGIVFPIYFGKCTSRVWVEEMTPDGCGFIGGGNTAKTRGENCGPPSNKSSTK